MIPLHYGNLSGHNSQNSPGTSKRVYVLPQMQTSISARFQTKDLSRLGKRDDHYTTETPQFLSCALSGKIDPS